MRSMVEGEAVKLNGPEPTIKRAKQLRRAMTLPEIILWKALRDRPAGMKFCRQHPAGPYVLDFYCDGSRLCVEVGGEVHGRGDQPERDEARDEWLSARRVRVLRIAATEVLRNLDAVVRHIVAHA